MLIVSDMLSAHLSRGAQYFIELLSQVNLNIIPLELFQRQMSYNKFYSKSYASIICHLYRQNDMT